MLGDSIGDLADPVLLKTTVHRLVEAIGLLLVVVMLFSLLLPVPRLVRMNILVSGFVFVVGFGVALFSVSGLSCCKPFQNIAVDCSIGMKQPIATTQQGTTQQQQQSIMKK
eukprot:16451850-Heterocapsa_arctica.AAC.2